MSTAAVIGYVRVSTSEQADRGLSLKAQRNKVLSMAMLKDVQIVEDARESAKSLQRPGLKSILKAVPSEEVRTIIIAKLDRLTRTVRDLDSLLTLMGKHRCALVSVSETIDTDTRAGRTDEDVSLIAEAQAEGAPDFDLVICDEAHRTTDNTAYGTAHKTLFF